MKQFSRLKNNLIYLLFGILLFLGLTDYLNLNGIGFVTKFSIIKSSTDFILYFTLIGVFIYAFETYKLRLESQNQTKLSLMPLPVIFLDKNDEFKIKNEGNGPMLNVRIEPWNINITDLFRDYTVKFSVSDPNIIEAKEEKNLLVSTFEKGKEVEIDLSVHLKPAYSNFFIPLTVTFEDIQGTRYKQVIEMGKGKMSIKETPQIIKKKVEGMELERVVAYIREGLSILEQEKDLVEYNKISDIRRSIQVFDKEQNEKNAREIEQELRSANVHVENEEVEKHIMNREFTINDKKFTLDELLVELSDSIETEYISQDFIKETDFKKKSK